MDWIAYTCPPPLPAMETAILLCCLAAQFGLQPLLNRAMIVPGIPNSSVVLGAEVVKIGLAVILLLGTPDWRIRVKEWTLRDAVVRAGMPAAMYSLTNWLILFASRNLPPLTLSLLNQTKTLSAAIWSYMLLGKIQTPPQILSLLILAIGAYLVVSADQQRATTTTNVIQPNNNNTQSNQDVVLGMIAIISASMLSGIASALTERALSKSLSAAWSFIFSIEIAMFGIVTMLTSLLMGLNPDQTFLQDPFRGWTWHTVIPCMSTAMGGLLVGLVTQRAGGVRKGFALIAGICITCLVEGLFGLRQLLPTHFVAVLLVCISMWLHAWGGASRRWNDKTTKVA